MAEILVIGGGLAGAAAGLTLKRALHTVTVLEGRDRPGGRARSALSAGGHPIELGGAWIAPWHHRIRALATQFGYQLAGRTPLGHRFRHDGQRLRQAPFARSPALRQIIADSMMLASGHSFADLSFGAYRDRLARDSAADRCEIDAWWMISGGANPALASAEDLLRFCGYGDHSLDGMVTALEATVIGGIGALAADATAAAADRIECGTDICKITHDTHGVMAEAVDGRRFRADAAVIALGVGALARVAFDPAIDHDRRRAVEAGNVCRSVKIVAEAQGVAPGTLATGGGTGLQWLWAELTPVDGTVILTGFGPPTIAEALHRGEGAAMIARLLPQASLAGLDWHDWNADPFSAGAWVTPRLGHHDVLDWARWQSPAGPIAFASSDFAPVNSGWFEGALAAGEAAAEALLQRLGAGHPPRA